MKTPIVASMLVMLLATGTAAWAQDAAVDGFTYSGDGVDVTSVEADIEFGEVILSIESAEGGTLTVTLDSSVLGLVDGEFTAMVDAQAAEFATTTTDAMMEIVIDIPAGGNMVVLSGLEDAMVVATSPETTDEPIEETATEEAMVEEETAVEETVVEEETTVEETVVEEETVTEEAMVEEETAVETTTVADFVEPGVDIAVYVDRYLNDGGFSSWYDEWYPDTAIHESLGLTQTEYQAVVDDLTKTTECPDGMDLVDEQCITRCGPGTVMEDGMCVADSRTAGMSASDADGFRAQGEGLQLGVAAAAGFGGAVGVVLLLWLPSRVRKRWLNRKQTAEE